jgi:hypothetical protein
LPRTSNLDDGSIQDAIFSVLLTLKGERPKNGTIATHTESFGGNCGLDLLHPHLLHPLIVLYDDDGRAIPNQYSDIWVLFVDGKEPFRLWHTKPSWPLNAYTEADLRFLLHDSQAIVQPNPSFERTR